MRFTSLIVELLRARPRLMFWITVLLQAALWLILPMLLYTSPPGDIPAVLAFGREYQVGTNMGPPLALWLADIAFRAAGGHIFGVYLLSQICFVVTMWAVFRLARAIVGKQQGILALLLTATIAVFSYPGVEFGPLILARPLWALVLLHAWRIMGEGQRKAWFLLSVEAGLLCLTIPSAVLLVAILGGFALATQRGRQALKSFDPLFATLVVLVMALPYLVWLSHTGASLPRPHVNDPLGRLKHWGELFGGMLFALSGIAVLVTVNLARFNRNPEDAPVIYRPPLDLFTRQFVYVLALAPPIVLSFLSALFDLNHVVAGEGAALLLVGLAVIVAAGDLIYLRRQEVLRTLWLLAIFAPAIVPLFAASVQPWTGSAEIKTLLPASDMGRYFGENYRLRVERPLRIVAGDAQLAALIGFSAPSRPRVFFDAAPNQTPWLTFDAFAETGGVVVWRASETANAPPDQILNHFPGLVAEVPRVFDRRVNGRQDVLRVGWGIVRPKVAQDAK